MNRVLAVGGIGVLLYFFCKRKMVQNNNSSADSSAMKYAGGSSYYNSNAAVKANVPSQGEIYGDLTLSNTQVNRAGVTGADVELYLGELSKAYDRFYDFRDDISKGMIGYLKPGNYAYPYDAPRAIRWRIYPGQLAVSYVDKNLLEANRYPVSSYKYLYLYSFKFNIEVVNPLPFPITLEYLKINELEYCYQPMLPKDERLKVGFSDKYFIYGFDIIAPNSGNSENKIINPGINHFTIQLYGKGNLSYGWYKYDPLPTLYSQVECHASNAMLKLKLEFKDSLTPTVFNSTIGAYADAKPVIAVERFWEHQYWDKKDDWDFFRAVKTENIDNVWAYRQ